MNTVNCRRGTGKHGKTKEEAKASRRIFLDHLIKAMLPLGDKTKTVLVPKNYNMVKSGRVKWQSRLNPETQKLEHFLPRSSLEKVVITKRAFFRNRVYYEVFTGSKSVRIIWSKYCVSVESEEIVSVVIHPK